MSKMRKTPLRKCVVTQEMLPKETLVRIVRTKDGEVSVDPTGKKNGRGAYISKSKEILEKAQKSGILSTHLNATIDPFIYEQLKEIIESELS